MGGAADERTLLLRRGEHAPDPPARLRIVDRAWIRLREHRHEDDVRAGERWLDELCRVHLSMVPDEPIRLGVDSVSKE